MTEAGTQTEVQTEGQDSKIRLLEDVDYQSQNSRRVNNTNTPNIEFK